MATSSMAGTRAILRPVGDGSRSEGGRPAGGDGSASTTSFATTFHDASCLPALRAWLRRHLHAAGDLQVDAELVCTELVANAVDHAAGPCVARLRVEDATLIVEVDDASPHAVLLVGRSRIHAGRGRGLLIVDRLSRWGVHRGVTGKTVWAALQVA